MFEFFYSHSFPPIILNCAIAFSIRNAYTGLTKNNILCSFNGFVAYGFQISWDNKI